MPVMTTEVTTAGQNKETSTVMTTAQPSTGAPASTKAPATMGSTMGHETTMGIETSVSTMEGSPSTPAMTTEGKMSTNVHQQTTQGSVTDGNQSPSTANAGTKNPPPSHSEFFFIF